MRFNKKKIFVCSIILILLSLVAVGTVANYTTQGKVRNVITSGGLDIEVIEQQLVDGKLEPYPSDQPIPVMPGRVVSKIVSVTNHDAPAYIRAKYEVVATDPEGNILDAGADKIWFTTTNEDWIKREEDDGWFYYKEAVDTDKSTTTLFEEVNFSAVNIDNEYAGCTVRVIVYAEAVQAANNGDSVLDALGWEVK